MNRVQGFESTPLKEAYLSLSIDWKSIFAGVIITLAVGTLFNIFGIAIGLSAFTPNSSLDNFSLTAGVWMLFSAAISMGAGGWVAVYLSEKQTLSKVQSGLSGIVVWGVATLITLNLMLAATGTLAGGALGVLVKGASSMPALIQRNAQHLERIEQQAKIDSNKLGISDLSSASYKNETSQSNSEALESTKKNVLQEMEKTSNVLASISFFIFFTLLLGGISAAAGGIFAANIRTNTQTRV